MVVPEADAVEGFWGDEAEELVYLALEVSAGLRCAGRHGDYQPARSQLAQRLDSGAHGGAGGEAVVHQDDGALRHRRQSPVAAVEPLASLQLGLLAGGDGVDLGLANAQGAHDVRVEDADATGGDGAQGQFLLAGDAQLADDVHVQGGVEGASDLVGNRHAAAW